MESLALSRDAEKASPASPLRTALSSSGDLLSDQIPTPEKRIQLPRRAGRRSLCFSVNDVRRIAMEKRRTRSEAVIPPDPPRSDPVAMSSSARNAVKLPENFEMLAEFFNCLDSSIRLLRLKGVASTLTNLTASIQCLAERRFTYKHLAQLKHILPESISIKKLLLRDEATCSMKPELLVSLQVDSVDSKLIAKGENAFSTLRKIFRDRLVQFVREHSEEDEIPEDTLPYPFGHTSPRTAMKSNESIPSVLSVSSSAAQPSERITTASHFCGSFKRRFSQRTPCSDEMKSPLLVSPLRSLVSPLTSPVKVSSKLSIHNEPLFSSPGKSPLKIHNTKIEEDSKTQEGAHSSLPSGSTPVKEVSTPARLMASTPELQTPKRSCESSIDGTPEKKRATRTRLFPTPRKNLMSDGAENLSENPAVKDDVIGFLPESLLQDIKKKQRIAMEERATNAAGTRLRKEMIAKLPKLLNSILLIFQSRNRSVVTKQELVHNILSTHCNVLDRNEVEEQLVLMQELVPDWISQKISMTGDILYRLNRISNPQEIRRVLATAE